MYLHKSAPKPYSNRLGAFPQRCSKIPLLSHFHNYRYKAAPLLPPTEYRPIAASQRESESNAHVPTPGKVGHPRSRLNQARNRPRHRALHCLFPNADLIGPQEDVVSARWESPVAEGQLRNDDMRFAQIPESSHGVRRSNEHVAEGPGFHGLLHENRHGEEMKRRQKSVAEGN